MNTDQTTTTPTEIPDSTPAPAPEGFTVLPRMVDNAVIIDVRKDGELFGVITVLPQAGGNSGFYTGAHLIKEELEALLKKANDDGYEEGFQVAGNLNAGAHT